ncbi:MAG: ABC transporter permease [Rhizobiales bacterium]|jgi:simple sugar transport system permease protein|nr:ABC transporter permease [Hyphomicrobiales bacterium]
MFNFLFDAHQLSDFLGSGIGLSVPLIFAAVGGVICERAGVFNIALEGQMLLGALAAAVGANLSGSAEVGLISAVLTGALSGVLLSILGVSLRGNQIVIGLAITLFASGFTSFMSRVLFPEGANSLRLDGFRPFGLPLLENIPFFGKILFQQDALFYLMLILVAVTMFVIYRTQLGLSIRAIGENPGAADTAGVPVMLLRYSCVIAGSAIAAIGGAYIVLAQVFLFSDNITAGKGFIALGAIVLGRWNPLFATLACLLFGVFDALQLRMQATQPDIPAQLFAAMPYVISILAFVGLIGLVHPPAAGGKHYDREVR